MIQFSPPSPPLRSLVQTYVHLQVVADEPIYRPVPARSAQALEFTLGEPYRVHRCDYASTEIAHPVAIIGSQTFPRVRLEISGNTENFVVVFQPAGMDHLLATRSVEFTNQHFDAHDVLGRTVHQLAAELSDTSTFAGRISVANRFFESRISGRLHSDHLASVAREILRDRGRVRVTDLADRTGLSLRQFERRFTERIGMTPKMYARIVRFESAVLIKTRSPAASWTAIAHDLGYYDQMHMVHDFRLLSGSRPTSIAAQLEPFVEAPITSASAT